MCSVLVGGYIVSPPLGRLGSGGCSGGEAGGVVVPSGAGLVPAPPPGPAQVEGEAGAGDAAGGLGDGEPEGADAGRAGLPGPGGDGRVAERDAQVSVVSLVPAVAPAVIVPVAVFESVVVAAGGGRGREG